jgi:hypothetical protein
MDQNYRLIVAGKNVVLNAEGFLEALHMEAVPDRSGMAFEEALALMKGTKSQATLLATIYNGQPLVLDHFAQRSPAALEASLQQFTRQAGTDALACTLLENEQFPAFQYFREGKMLRSVDANGGEPVHKGIRIPYESTGSDPALVLTAFCASWMVLKRLPWSAFHLMPKLAT